MLHNILSRTLTSCYKIIMINVPLRITSRILNNLQSFKRDFRGLMLKNYKTFSPYAIKFGQSGCCLLHPSSIKQLCVQKKWRIMSLWEEEEEKTRLKGFFSPLALCKGCEVVEICHFYCNLIQYAKSCLLWSICYHLSSPIWSNLSPVIYHVSTVIG